MRVIGNLVVVAATVNGTPATLMVDTGANVTILSKAIAERADVTVPADARLLPVRVAGGGTISVPFVPLKSLAIGAATVEDLDVGVYDVLPGARRIDGLVGGDFLRHFRVALDHDARRLTLEVRADATAGSSAPSPLPGAPPVPGDVSARDPGSAPVWMIGDRWAFRWESPRGSGTFVWAVNRVQTVDGFECYVGTPGDFLPAQRSGVRRRAGRRAGRATSGPAGAELCMAAGARPHVGGAIYGRATARAAD